MLYHFSLILMIMNCLKMTKIVLRYNQLAGSELSQNNVIANIEDVYSRNNHTRFLIEKKIMLKWMNLFQIIQIDFN